MIIAKIITAIVIISLLIIGLMTIVTLGTNALPMNYVLYNNISGEQTKYNIPVNNSLAVQPFDYKTYNKSTATICIDLIRRIEERDTTVPYTYGMQKDTEFCNKLNNNIFCCVWDSPSTIWVSIRGTENLKEWKNNFKIEQLNYANATNEFDTLPAFMNKYRTIMLHKGFLSLFNELNNDLVSAISKLTPDRTKTICLSGHSLGAAISMILGMELYTLNYTKTCVYAFGCPRVGNIEFATKYTETNLPVFRFENTEDEFVNMPLAVSPNFKNAKNPYFYRHVGNPYRFTENLKSGSYNHSLYTYLKNLPA